MWHEARKQEKLVRSKMVDSAKRHERRKIFYESIRRDPEEFMQIHGCKAIIHMDATVANAAEASNILRKWQGDANVLIDRFDARAHLDHIPETAAKPATSSKQLLDDVQELQCEYERYRILILNEFLRVSERTCLNQISAKEFWPNSSGAPLIHKRESEKKKKLSDKKAAIGFSYSDTTVDSATTSFAKDCEKHSDSDLSDLDEMEEIDSKIDVESITPEQGAVLNKIGAKFNIGAGIFLKLLRIDCKEQDNNAQIKEIDRAKLALSGRQAKADRALLKRKRAMIVGKVTQNEEATTTLLSFLTNAKKTSEDDMLVSSSDSGDDLVEKTEFITCFGEDDDTNKGGGGRVASANLSDFEADNGGVVQGPILPTKEELKRRRSNSFEELQSQLNDYRQSTKSTKPSSPSGFRRSRSRSRNRYSRRHRSRSRSTSRRRRNSRSRSRSRPIHGRSSGTYRLRSRSNDRSRHRENSRQRYRKSSFSPLTRSSNGKKSKPIVSSNNNNKDSGRMRSTSSESRSASNSSGSDSPLTIHSSMSDSEKEQLEIENRKRRIRRIKREMRNQGHHRSNEVEDRQSEGDKRKIDLAKKLRQQMQKTLKKTAEQLKEEEEVKARVQIRERKQREEELLEEARVLRMREREKRRQEDEEAAAQRERERHSRRSDRRDESSRNSRRSRRYSSSS